MLAAVTSLAIATQVVGASSPARIPNARGVFHGCYSVRTGALRVIAETARVPDRRAESAMESAWTGAVRRRPGRSGRATGRRRGSRPSGGLRPAGRAGSRREHKGRSGRSVPSGPPLGLPASKGFRDPLGRKGSKERREIRGWSALWGRSGSKARQVLPDLVGRPATAGPQGLPAHPGRRATPDPPVPKASGNPRGARAERCAARHRRSGHVCCERGTQHGRRPRRRRARWASFSSGAGRRRARPLPRRSALSSSARTRAGDDVDCSRRRVDREPRCRSDDDGDGVRVVLAVARR